MADVLGRGVIEVSADASKLNAAINEARSKLRSLGDSGADASKRASSSIDRYVKSLQTQAAVQGKSTRETELYKLALRGATDEQLRSANSALKLQEGFKRGEDLAANIRTSAVAVAQAFVLIGAAAISGAVAFDRLVKSAGNFKDVAEKIGDTGEAVASLAVAAGESGTSLERITAGSVLLTKNLTGLDDESKAAGAAVKALGLNLGELQKLAAVDRLEAVAKALAGFADGPAKTAAAVALLGRSGAELLPFLKVLGEEGSRQVILTQKQIDLADAYADAQGKLIAETKLYAQAIAVQILPSVNDFIGGLKDLISEVAGTEKSIDSLKNNKSIADFADSGALFLGRLIDIAKRVAETFNFVGETIGGVVAMAAAAARSVGDTFNAIKGGDFKGAIEADKRGLRELGSIADQMFAAREKFAKGSASTEDAVAKRIADRRKQTEIGAGGGRGSAADPRRTDAPKKLNFTGAIKKDKDGSDKSARAAAREAEQVRRAELDNDLRFLRDKLGDERDTISFHQRELQAIYQAGTVSLQEFYDSRERIVADGVQRELDLLTDEQARLEVELNKPAVKANESERIKLEGQLAESIRRTAKVELDAGRDASLANRERIAATKQLNDAITDYRANLLQLQGNEAGAAEIRTKQTIAQAQALARQSGGQISQKQIDDLEVATVQTQQINNAKTATSNINQRLAIEEERIALAQRTGAIGELAALRQVGEARTSIFAQAEKEVVALERLAAERPFDIQLNLDASRARLELQKFAAELDPLKEKFDNLFKDAGESAIESLLNGTKSLKDAFKDFSKDIVNQLNKDAAKQLSGQIFGKGGILGDAGGVFADLFGGKSKGVPRNETSSFLGGLFGQEKTPEQAQPGQLFKAPVIDTTAATASLANLTNVGIDPTVSAFARLQAATDAAALSVAKTPSDRDPTAIETTGDFARFDRRTSGEESIAALFKEPTEEAGELSATLVDTRKNTEAFSDLLPIANTALSQLGRSGSVASAALSLLPQIINAIGAATGGGGSSGGGWIGSIMSLFGGGGGSSASSAAEAAELAALFLHTGGVVGQAGITRTVPVGMFAGAHRYHEGGSVAAAAATPAALAANEVPAILMGGPKGTREEVLHAKDPRHSDNIAPALLKTIEGGIGGDAIAKAIGGIGGKGGLGGPGGPGGASIGGQGIGGQAFAIGATGGKGGDAISAARESSPLMRTIVGPTNLISELRKETNTERFDTLREIKETGARALGGPVSAGGLYRINERGPEVLNMAGKQYMMPMQDGKVTSSSNTVNRERPLAVTNNFAFTAPVDRRSQQQVAAATLSGARRLAMRIS